MSTIDRAHDCLLTFYSNYGYIVSFPRYSTLKMSWPWNRSQRSVKVIEGGTIR